MDDTKDLTVFDPKVLADAVKDKIRLEILNVIPPEAWKAMIEKSVKDFVTDDPGVYRHDWGRYERQPVPSPLSQLINAEMEKSIKAELKEYFSSPEWQSNVWADGKIKATDAIKQIAVQAGPAIITKMIETVVQVSVQQALNQVANRVY